MKCWLINLLCLCLCFAALAGLKQSVSHSIDGAAMVNAHHEVLKISVDRVREQIKVDIGIWDTLAEYQAGKSHDDSRRYMIDGAAYDAFLVSPSSLMLISRIITHTITNSHLAGAVVDVSGVKKTHKESESHGGDVIADAHFQIAIVHVDRRRERCKVTMYIYRSHADYAAGARQIDSAVVCIDNLDHQQRVNHGLVAADSDPAAGAGIGQYFDDVMLVGDDAATALQSVYDWLMVAVPEYAGATTED